MQKKYVAIVIEITTSKLFWKKSFFHINVIELEDGLTIDKATDAAHSAAKTANELFAGIARHKIVLVEEVKIENRESIKKLIKRRINRRD